MHLPRWRGIKGVELMVNDKWLIECGEWSGGELFETETWQGNGNCSVSAVLITIMFYSAGWCFVVVLFEHDPDVKLEIFEYFAPQYLQTYCDLSFPSYGSCRLLLGFFEQVPEVKLEILEYLLPHHLQ